MTSQSLVIRDWLPDQLANGPHAHWATRQKKLKAAQVMVWSSAMQEGWKPVRGRARLTVVFVFPQQRRRDTDNLYSRAKGVVDGVRKGGWILDDSSELLDLIVRAEVQPKVKETRLLLEALP